MEALFSKRLPLGRKTIQLSACNYFRNPRENNESNELNPFMIFGSNRYSEQLQQRELPLPEFNYFKAASRIPVLNE